MVLLAVAVRLAGLLLVLLLLLLRLQAVLEQLLLDLQGVQLEQHLLEALLVLVLHLAVPRYLWSREAHAHAS